MIKQAIINQAPKELKTKPQEVQKEKGEVSQVAIVNQEAKDYYANLPQVEDVKEIAKEYGGTTDAYTKAETNALLDAKQPTLESGTNIKTINSQSLLGSGDLQISGEPSAYLKNASVSGNTLTLTKQDDTTINYSEFLIKSTIDATLVPYTKYYLGEQSSLTLTLPSGSVGDEIVVVFYSGATASTLAVSGTYLGTLPVPAVNQRIELNFVYDGLNWSLLSNTQSTGA